MLENRWTAWLPDTGLSRAYEGRLSFVNLEGALFVSATFTEAGRTWPVDPVPDPEPWASEQCGGASVERLDLANPRARALAFVCSPPGREPEAWQLFALLEHADGLVLEVEANGPRSIDRAGFMRALATLRPEPRSELRGGIVRLREPTTFRRGVVRVVVPEGWVVSDGHRLVATSATPWDRGVTRYVIVDADRWTESPPDGTPMAVGGHATRAQCGGARVGETARGGPPSEVREGECRVSIELRCGDSSFDLHPVTFTVRGTEAEMAESLEGVRWPSRCRPAAPLRDPRPLLLVAALGMAIAVAGAWIGPRLRYGRG
jgi:hypothetical protein